MGKRIDRLVEMYHAWNAFGREGIGPEIPQQELGPIVTHRPNRTRRTYAADKTIISAIYARIAIDVASVPIRHVDLNDEGQYEDDRQSGLADCLTIAANKDQTARAFIMDTVLTMFEEGVAALVPVDTTLNPLDTGGYDVNTMRVGRVLDWRVDHVRVRLYNDNPDSRGAGRDGDITLPKDMVALVENPLYTVMNEPSSTLRRLLRKLQLLDVVDEQSASGKLDLLIQLPYTIKTEARQQQAERRTQQIEMQLSNSKHGIAYTDGTEKVIQLNRPVENNLMNQVEYLTKMLYAQLGITEAVMDGTADPSTMINYYNRTIEPILAAITGSMVCKFLTKTARRQGQTLVYIRDPFKLMPIADLAEIADKLTRNAILSSNEFRSKIGFPPSKDPEADKLSNKNLPAAKQPGAVDPGAPPPAAEPPAEPDYQAPSYQEE